jgi:hypothetical protein
MTVLQCRSCSAARLVELDSEICLHFPGLKGLDVDPILGFPKLTVCLGCGSIQSYFSADELGRLREGAARIQANCETRR